MLAACGTPGPYYCCADSECVSNGTRGTCTSFNFCAFPDTSCSSGLRYHESAGELANVCVGQEMARGDVTSSFATAAELSPN